MTNIYKVPCYIEFEVDGELIPGSLKSMAKRYLQEANIILENESGEYGLTHRLYQINNKDVSVSIKEYELPQEFIKAVISLL